MKVLKEGKGYIVEVECTGKGNGMAGCGAILGISKEDVYMTSSSDYTGDTDYFYTITCPCCGVETDIDSMGLPQSVKKLARVKYGLHW